MKKYLQTVIKEKWNVVLFLVFVMVTAVAVLLIRFTGDKNMAIFTDGASQDISGDWHYEYLDGPSGTTDLPSKLPKSTSRHLYLSKVLPEVRENTYLVFKANHVFVRVTVDGKVLKDHISAEEEKNQWFTLEGIHFVEVEMLPEYSGKEIVIESYSSESKYLREPGEIFMGERGSFLLNRLRGKMTALVCCIILVVAAAATVSLWLCAIFLLKTNLRELLCLGFFALGVALWVLTESEMMQILGQATRASVVLAHEVLILMPVPITLYFFYAIEDKKWKRYSFIASVVPAGWYVLANLLHVLHILSMPKTLILTQILLCIEVVVIAVIQLSSGKAIHKSARYGAKLTKIPMLGVVVMLPLGLWEVGEYVFASGGHHENSIAITVGVIIYIFSLALDSVLRNTYKQAQLEESSSMKTQFLANMSHEIRTPLNAILGFNEAVIREPDNEEQVKGYAINIREAGENLKDIINSILDISKIEMGQLQIESREYSSMEMLDNLASMFELLAERKGLKLHTEIDPEVPSILIGDESHLRQILTNILSNAVKYTDTGSITLRVDVLDKAPDSPMCKMRFLVKDTGRGIREEDKKKLFEKFARLDTEHFKHVEGTGLGMSIVELTLSAMGSEIQMDSEFGKGTTFWFDIDQVAIDKNGIGDFEVRRAESALKENQSIRFRAPNAEVLIVDDVLMNIDAAKALLGFTQMKIDSALSGAQAIEMVQKKRYDIIFMDHMMPGIDGIEATEKIRNLSVEYNDAYYAMVPVIALTANAIVGVKTLYQQAGMQDFVSKPMQVTSIISALKRWLPKELIEEVSGDNLDEEAFGGDVEEENWELGIAGIDGTEAKKYNINVDGLKSNLHSYADAYESNSRDIKEFFENHDIKDYVTKVHGLKSTSKMIGAMEIYKLARTIEHKGAEENIIDEKEFKQLMSLYHDEVERLREYFAEEEKDNAVLSEAEYQTFLARVKKAGENFDTMEFMTLDEEMKSVSVPEEYKEEFDKLKLHVSLLQYTEASALVAGRSIKGSTEGEV